MLQTGFPVGVRMGVSEVVMMTMFFFCKDAAADHWLTVYCICASLIQSNRVEGSEHTDIWYDRNIIFSMAVAVWGNIDYQTDVEIRFIFDDCIGVFSDLAVENIICFAGSSFYSIFWTCTNAAAAANAFVVVNKCTFLCILRSARLPGLFSPV